MAYKGFVGSGTVGHFLTTTDLQNRFPADTYAGRRATVEITVGSATQYFSDGLSWKPIPLLATDANLVTVNGLVTQDGSVKNLRRKTRRIMSRSLTGRAAALPLTDALFPANSNTNGLSLHYRVAAACDFDAIRILVPNMHTSTVSGVTASIGLTDALGTWQTTAPTANNIGANTTVAPVSNQGISSTGTNTILCTFSSATSATLPPAIDAASLMSSYTPSDWIPASAVTRTDGGTFPLVDVRLYYPAGSTATMAYTGGTYNAWAMWGRDDLITGGRAWRVWAQAVESVATPANFTSVSTVPYMVPIVVQYRARKSGAITTLVCGDSIYEGSAGATYTGNNFTWLATLDLSTTDAPMEQCNLTIPGGSTLVLSRYLAQLISLVKPSVVVAETASVNNFGSTLGQRTIQNGLGALGVAQANAYEVDCQLVTATMFPVTNAAKAYGATDSFRQSLNTLIKTNSDSGNAYTVIDAGTVLDGGVVSGQTEPLPSVIAADGVHLNDTGHLAMKPLVKAALSAALARLF